MSPRSILAAVLALSLAGCTLTDRRDDPAILPAGTLYGGNALQFEVRAPAGAQANLRVDGVDFGTVQVNAPVSFRTTGLADGPHTLRVTVFDGPYPVAPLERAIVVDRIAPTYTARGLPPGPAAGPLVVTLTFSEPVRPQSLAGLQFWAGSRALPTSLGPLSADGLTITAQLDVPLGDYLLVTLPVRAVDLAGNPVDPERTPDPSFGAPPSALTLTAPAEVDEALTVSAVLPPGWTGPAGPITFRLCPASTGGFEPTPVLDACAEATVPDAASPATFDTSALPAGPRFLLGWLPGYGPSVALRTNVFHHALSVSLRASKLLTNGPVRIDVTATGGFPDQLEIMAGTASVGVVLATRGQTGTFSSSLTWTGEVPDGFYTLGARAPDWRVSVASADTVQVDRTPPVATAAWPAALDTHRVRLADLHFSEPVRGTLRWLLDGQPYAEVILTTPVFQLAGAAFSSPVAPWRDATIQVDASGLTDAAGNPAMTTLALALPVWQAPAGEGPLQAEGATIVASEAAVMRFGTVLGVDPLLAFVDAAGQVREGFASGLGPSPLNTAGTTAAGLITGSFLADQGFPSLAWTETTASGSTLRGVRLLGQDVFDSATTPLAPGASAVRVGSRFRSYSPWLSWTEPDGAGGRAIRFQDWYAPAGDVPAGLPTSALDAVEDAIAATSSSSGWLVLAWIDGAGPVPQLALATSAASGTGAPQGPWTPLAASVNADPAQAASEPALSSGHVAWIESGRVRAGRVTPGQAGLAFVRSDPASGSEARWPAFCDRNAVPTELVLVFVEPGAGGDVIAARLWTEAGGWASLPPVNMGVAGEVRSLKVDSCNVTWTDAAGHVFARELNR